MNRAKDNLNKYKNNAKKDITKKFIGILFISIIAVIGVTLTGCAVVPTVQGKGMAAGVKDEIELDVSKKEPEESKDGEENKKEDKDSENKEVEDRLDEQSEEDEEDSIDEDESRGEDNNSSQDTNEEPQVTSVYNTMVPPYMMPSSEELSDRKFVYLTFDDGPSRNITPEVLDILKEHNIKATFFVIGNLAEENPEIIERAAREGHTIANHSYSHQYKAIYASTEAFMAEIEQTDKVLSDILGENYKPKYVRLPGGGFGPEYNDIKSTLIKDGYNYITWNAVTNDAVERNASPEKLFANLKETLNGNHYSVVLMHDAPAQKNTPKALSLTIEYLKNEGYEFRTFEY